jgi:hypothetical protein
MLKARKHKIRFRKGDLVASQETVNVSTLLSTIIFYVLFINILFLFCIKDIDNIGVKLYNLKNMLVQETKVVPVIRK